MTTPSMIEDSVTSTGQERLGDHTRGLATPEADNFCSVIMRRFGGLIVTFGYDYFDYINYFNHHTSSSEASSKRVPEMKTCMPRRPWRQRFLC